MAVSQFAAYRALLGSVLAPTDRRPADGTKSNRRLHLIENFFCKLKEFKRIAMRSDKTDQSFAAMIHLAAAVIASR